MYTLWERILTTETLFMVSCWKHDTHEAPVPIHREDMVADFAPMFDTLHDESCMKCASLSSDELWLFAQMAAIDGCSHALWLLLSCCLSFTFCFTLHVPLLIVDLVMSRDAATLRYE